MGLVMLGIPNCDTVKKARVFLEENKIDYKFRNLKKEPLSKEEWKKLISQDKEDKLINTRGPSFRKTGLNKEDLTAVNKLEILLENPSIMKRPTLLKVDKIQSIGFSVEEFSKYL